MQGHCLYPREAFPKSGTRTRRRDARRDLRRIIGTSSDDAPGLLAALDAAEQLRRIIDMASGGRYGLAIVRPMFANEYTQVRIKEQYTYADIDGVIYTEPTMEASSQIHEPVSETRRRERQLRREGDGHAVE